MNESQGPTEIFSSLWVSTSALTRLHAGRWVVVVIDVLLWNCGRDKMSTKNEWERCVVGTDVPPLLHM